MLQQFKQFLMILVAVLLLAVAINMFLGPHHIAAGGVSGIGILVENFWGINKALVVLFLNIIMLVFALIFLGKKIFLNTVIGSLLFPITLAIVPNILLTSDLLLSVVFGSTIFAIGVAILYRIQASSGGTTIPPLIFKKYFKLDSSVGLFLTDFIIVFMNIFVFSFESFLYAILSVIITLMVMTFIETGLKRKKAIMVISINKSESIQKEIQKEINRGLTIFKVQGGRTKQEREMLMIISSNQEYPKIKEIIYAIDSKSFIVTYNVSEVSGLGFTYHPIQ